MIEYYPEIRNVHIIAVILSGLLFAMRGIGLIYLLAWPRSIFVRYTSYSIDTILLTAALILMTIIHQYPVANAWLSIKVTFLCVYIFLGICAFRQNQSHRKRILFYLGALFVYAFIFSVARAHHPLGFLR